MKAQVVKAFVIGMIISMSQNVLAASGQTGHESGSWLMKMIYQPSPSLLRREARGFVNIYDGFTDTQVDEVLDHKFERIGHMMFTRIKKNGQNWRCFKRPSDRE